LFVFVNSNGRLGPFELDGWGKSEGQSAEISVQNFITFIEPGDLSLGLLVTDGSN